MSHLRVLGVMLGCSAITCTSSPATPPLSSASKPEQPTPPVIKSSLPSPGWSPAVNGLRGRLLVSPGAGTLPRTVRVDLELENVSDVANPIEIYWDIDGVLSFSLADGDGREIANTPTAASIRRSSPHWLMLPFDSALRINITTHGYGVMPEPGVFIGLPHMDAWQFEASDMRRRLLHGVFTATATVAAHDRQWQGTLDLPIVEIP